MKTKSGVFLAACLACANLCALATTNDLSATLQRGLFEEEANHDLRSAIAAYESVISHYDENRSLAATAVFRLGECERKQGLTNEATAHYERILRDFSDQPTLVTLSRQGLVELRGAATGNSTLRNGADQAQLAGLEVQLRELKKLSKEELRTAVQQQFPNPVLDSLIQKLTAAQADLARAQIDYGPQHPQVVKATDIVEMLNKQIDDQVNVALKGLEMRIEVARSTAEAQHNTTDLLESTSPATLGGFADAAEVSRIRSLTEAAEINRIRSLIKESPDLINAKDESQGGATLLHKAAMNGQLAVAEFLLANGADIEARTPVQLETPLHFAAINGHRAMVELLLNHKANIQAAEWDGSTALHIATGKAFKSLVELLLARGANANARTKEGTTPLHIAAANGFPAIAEILLAHGADSAVLTSSVLSSVNERFSGTPLHVAASRGDSAMVELLLTNRGDVNALNDRGQTPLAAVAEQRPTGSATQEGLLEIAKLLVAHGANVNATNSQGWHLGWTPLHDALYSRKSEILRLLLNSGADPNARIHTTSLNNGSYTGRPRTGYTPLLIATELGVTNTIASLLDFKADPNMKSDEGELPIFLALNSNLDVRKTILALLLDHGADANVSANEGQTPLMKATWSGDKDSIQLLLSHKAEVNAQDSQGNTALKYAANGRQNEAEIAEMLLAAGADPNIRDAGGRTVLSSEIERTRPKLAELLRKYGASEDLPRPDVIGVRRAATGYANTLFYKGTNDWNHFTLLELLAVQYHLLSRSPSGEQVNRWGLRLEAVNEHEPGFPKFPDLENVRLRRPAPDMKGWNEKLVDVAAILNSGDCSKDQKLQWGDVLEIPETVHSLDDQWQGFSASEINTFQRCLTRQVEIVVKGKSTTLTLIPGRDIGIQDQVGNERERTPFWIKPVLAASHLLLSSSDLSRVKVTRHDQATGKTHEWIVNCGDSSPVPVFWLRDGDVIEVPEK